MYSYLTDLFEIELIIYIKIDLALNNLEGLIYHKTQQTTRKLYLHLNYVLMLN